MELSCVPYIGDFVLFNDIDGLIELAKGESIIGVNSPQREGIVIRPIKEIIDKEAFSEFKGCEYGRVSFKAINPEYSLLEK